MAQLREQLRTVQPGDVDTWARVARQTSGAYAAWSMRVEPPSGPLAAASAALARSAQTKTKPSAARPAVGPSVAATAMLLAAAATDNRMAQALLLRQMLNLSKAVYDAAKASGDARRAEAIETVVRRDLAELHASNVRVRMIGDRDGLARDIAGLVDEAEALTRANTGLTFIIAFNYGSRDEITRAVQRIAARVERGEIAAADVCAQMVSDNLDTAGIPDPDLIIRTSGELRLSNFLLWQAAYAEFLFPDCYWPDFSERHLREAVEAFATRDRRFGGIGQQDIAL